MVAEKYITTMEWIMNEQFYGVWDAQRSKLVNLEMNIDFRKTEEEAKNDADSLNKGIKIIN